MESAGHGNKDKYSLIIETERHETRDRFSNHGNRLTPKTKQRFISAKKVEVLRKKEIYPTVALFSTNVISKPMCFGFVTQVSKHNISVNLIQVKRREN